MYDNGNLSELAGGGASFGVGLPENYFGAGFGGATESEIRKALTIGTQHPAVSGGMTLTSQSLEGTMRVTTLNMSHIKFYKKLSRLGADNTVLEYNLQDSYGQTRAGAFTKEGELPQQQDAAYRRALAQVKYLGTQRGVSHPMTVVKSAFGNVIALETTNGVIYLMYQLEKALFKGDSTIVPESFDGIFQQIVQHPVARRRNIIDLRNGVVTQDIIEQASNIIVSALGEPTDLVFSPKAHSDYSRQFYPIQRAGLPIATSQGTVGFVVQETLTTGGMIKLENNLFLRPGEIGSLSEGDTDKAPPSVASSPKAPLPPTIALAAAVGIGSKFSAADVGTYRIRVSAKNRFGESAASSSSSVLVAAAGDGIQITITDGGGLGDQTTTGFIIYRSADPNAIAGTEEVMVEVPRTPGATTITIDANDDIPGTSKALMYNASLQVMSWRQLLPMMKVALATTAPSVQWMQLLYGTPIVYQPTKVVLLRNIRDRQALLS